MSERTIAWVLGPLVGIVGFLLIRFRHPISREFRQLMRRTYAGTRMESQADRVAPWWAVLGGVFCLIWAGIVIVVVGILNIPI